VELVAVSATEDTHLGAGSKLKKRGRGGGIDDRHDWSRDGCSGWHTPYRQWCLIQVGGGSVSLISWPRDTCHMVREMCGTLCI